MNAQPIPRRPFLASGSLLLVLAASFALAVSSAHASSLVEALVIKFRDGVVSDAATALPGAQVQLISTALQSGFFESGRMRDGGFRITLDPALPINDARSALNRVRMDSSVLYASVAQSRQSGASTAASPGTPPRPRATNRLIVKFSGASARSAALAGVPLERPQLDRITNLAGTPVAFRRYMHDGAAVLQLMSRMPVDQVERIANRIGTQTDVEFAQPDYIDHAQLTPNDTCYPIGAAALPGCNIGYQWDLFDAVAGINAPAAWNLTTGSSAIKVAVIDTGALPTHPDLSGRFAGGYDMIADCAIANDGSPSPCTFSPLPYDSNNPPSPAFDSRDTDASDPGDWVSEAESYPCAPSGNCSIDAPPPPYYDWFSYVEFGCVAENSSWHGTHVAGTIGAIGNNGTGIAGINWVSQIVPVRVLGKCGGYVSDIADGIAWASGGTVIGLPVNANPAQVLNLSLGGFRSPPTCDPAYAEAINGALSRNVVVVVSAGNDNWDVSYDAPANCPGVITVAATGEKGFKSHYSNWGAQMEIAAPGGDFRLDATTSPNQRGIVSSLNSGATSPNPSGYNYVQYQGTSMAAPHVTGVVSLMLSANPALTPAQVLAKIQVSARAFAIGASACSTANVPSIDGIPSVPNANWFACNCTTALCGAGLLDAFRAVSVAASAGAATTTSVTSTANPSTIGGSVTFNSTVAGIVPTGTVAFKDGDVTIAGCAAIALTGTGDSRTASCTASALPVGSRSITAVYSGDGNNATSTSTVLIQMVNVVVMQRKRINFDANATDDIAWRSAGGQTALWLMNGLTRGSSAVVLDDPAWTVTHTGDLNGDNMTDLVWRNASGATAAWLMNGTGYTTWGMLYSDPTWVVQRLADFNGDGKADILWRRSTTGQTAIWTMNGLAPMTTSLVVSDSNWVATLTGDFNGDGMSDIVWRNSATGQTAIWLMNGVAPSATAVILSDANWTVTHVADFDGNGTSDLLWRNAGTGQTAIWLMNGLTPSASAVLFVSGANWTVTHTGDLDGNGTSDLIWRNSSTGATAVWLQNGLVTISSTVVMTDASWSVTHLADLNGDGKMDLLWRQTGTGYTSGWLMNGSTYSSYATLLFDPNWTVSPANGL